MKPARYFPDPNLNAFTPCVAKESGDGTFDLFYSEKSNEPFCTGCPGSDEPKLGHVVLEKEKAKAEKSEKKDK